MNCDQLSVLASRPRCWNSCQSAMNITMRKTQSRAVLWDCRKAVAPLLLERFDRFEPPARAGCSAIAVPAPSGRPGAPGTEGRYNSPAPLLQSAGAPARQGEIDTVRPAPDGPRPAAT